MKLSKHKSTKLIDFKDQCKVGSDKLYHTIYSVKNIKNNKEYIGRRSFKKPPSEDFYLASPTDEGFIEEYTNNPENFTKTILGYYNSKEEVIEKEKSVVNASFVKRKDTYNKTTGGKGSTWQLNTEEAQKKARKNFQKVSLEKYGTKCGIIQTPEIRSKAIENTKKWWIAYDLSGNFLGAFKGLKGAVEKFNIPTRSRIQFNIDPTRVWVKSETPNPEKLRFEEEYEHKCKKSEKIVTELGIITELHNSTRAFLYHNGINKIKMFTPKENVVVYDSWDDYLKSSETK